MKENIIVGIMVIAVVAGGVGYSVITSNNKEHKVKADAMSMTKQLSESAAMQKEHEAQAMAKQAEIDAMKKDEAIKPATTTPEPAGDAMLSNNH